MTYLSFSVHESVVAQLHQYLVQGHLHYDGLNDGQCSFWGGTK